MPLPGGAADKYGNRYETYWTIFCITDVMEERAQSIRLEPPGIEGDGIEFWLCRNDGTKEFHQVKRQTAKGYWSLNDLARNGVLGSILKHIYNSDDRFRFVSMNSVHQLTELSDHARNASNFEEFQIVFLKSAASRASFDSLIRFLNGIPDVEVYRMLKRIFVDSISEDVLRRTVESKLNALVDAPVGDVVSHLFTFVFDNVHRELTSYDIWASLEAKGFKRRAWGNDPHVIAGVERVNQVYEGSLEHSAIAGLVIPRDEVRMIEEKLKSSKVVLVTGEAGSGKSMILWQVMRNLHEQGWPIIALRVDRLDYTSLPENLGQQVGLPGSPVSVLGAISKDKDSLVVIDQLDCISMASGRRTEFFDCISELIRELQSYKSMRLVVACRKFDLENDSRLRKFFNRDLEAEIVEVQRFDTATVRGILEKLGINANEMPEKQLNLLTVPLHLSLFTEVVSSNTFAFETVLDLYTEFWKCKQQQIRGRIGQQIRWVEVIDRLCDYMSTHQTLSVPKSIMDDLEPDVSAMVSEHVLTFDGRQYGFFHEGFFDYAFARRFSSRGQTILEFLLSEEQHLFRRAQVRQILQYQRDENFHSYLHSVRSLLTSPDVRFHIKQVVFTFLGSIAQPRDEEWRILNFFLNCNDVDMKRQAWNALYGSAPWVRFLSSTGILQHWFERGKHIDELVSVITSVYKDEPDIVGKSLEPYIGRSDEWDNRIANFFRWAEVVPGTSLFKLFIKAIDYGLVARDKQLNGVFWRLVNTLSKSCSISACEAIKHYLDNLDLNKVSANDFRVRLFDAYDHDLRQALQTCATNSPKEFVSAVLPFMLRVMKRFAYPVEGSDSLVLDRVWSYRHYGTNLMPEDVFLETMTIALGAVARQSPMDYEEFVGMLKSSNFEAANYLLVRSFSQVGELMADTVVDYLCERPQRLNCGYIDSPHWCTRLLIEAVTPHCSEESIRRLEALLLEYYPHYERTVAGFRRRGFSQMILLEGIAEHRRSWTVRRRIQEWRRKFGDRANAVPHGIEGGVVGSPISESAVQKMTDDQWLRAISKYNEEFSSPGRFLVGGAHELSLLLEREVRRDPERFSKLVMRFPDDTHTYYFDAVLRGLQESSIEVAAPVIRRCHEIPGRPVGASIARLIGRFSKDELDSSLYEILAWYAVCSTDPEVEWWRTPSSVGGQVYYGGDPLQAGINSVRGSAAYAIFELLRDNPSRLSFFNSTLRHLVRDSSIAVRSCAAACLIPVLSIDRDIAVELFLELCQTEDILLRTPYVREFMRYALVTHFDQLQPILCRILDPQADDDLHEAGAELLAVLSVVRTEFLPYVEECLTRGDACRKGVCKIYAMCLHLPQYRATTEDILTRLFWDPNPEIREIASSSFNYFESDELQGSDTLIIRFLDSPAFSENHRKLTWALEQTTAKLPDITIRVCEKVLDLHERGMEHGYMDERVIMKLAMREYQQTEDSTIKSKCLDLVDKVARLGVSSLNVLLDAFDR